MPRKSKEGDKDVAKDEDVEMILAPRKDGFVPKEAYERYCEKHYGSVPKDEKVEPVDIRKILKYPSD